MSSRKRKLLVVLGVLVLIFGGFVLRTLIRAGAFLTIEPHGPAPLRIIEGFRGGTEDLVFRPGGREVFVSSADFRDPTTPGGIFLADVQAGTMREVTPKLDFPLQPHGLDLWVGEGRQRLFVVNHRNGSGFTQVAGDVSEVQHTIEIFDVSDDGSLTYVATRSGPALVSPNDVGAAGFDTFYVSNDHGWGPGLPRLIEEFGQLPIGNVVYFDGSAFREVYSGTQYANGVKVTPDGKTVYLAESVGGCVTRFDRDPTNGDLTRRSKTPRFGGPDNISLDDDGSLWIAAHPKMLTFLSYAEDPHTRTSPSQILRMTSSGDAWTSEEVYLSAGKPMSAATVAAPGNSVIVVGAVFEPKIMVLPRE